MIHVRAPSILFLSLSILACAHKPSSQATQTVVEESFPDPGIHLVHWTVLYTVHGVSLRELAAEMNRIGPIDDGNHLSARTWSRFAWKYPFERTADTCRTGPVTIELEVQQIFPSWSPPADAKPSAVREWQRWVAATRAHEDGHSEISRATATRILNELNALAAKSTCEEVDRAANEVARGLVQRHNEEHSAFDRRTHHGLLTGARLNQTPENP
jgi:predicted secreted Zn-dependent protease